MMHKAWTTREESILRQGLTAGRSRSAIARDLGRSLVAVKKRVRILGLMSSRPQARRVIPAIIVERTNTDDEAYIAACVAEGGFAPFTEEFQRRIEAARIRSAA